MKRLAKNQGFTLIELMITLVLSLMITYAIAQVLISSNRTSVTSDGMSQSQETGRFVMSYLANNIRQAGQNSTLLGGSETDAFVSCTDFPGLMDFNTPGNHQCTFETAIGGTDLNIINLANTGDRLAITHIPVVPLNAAVPPVRDPNLIRDCTGAGGYDTDEIILNVFWVAPDGNGMNSLFCRGHTFNGTTITRSNPAQAIANGVEAIHFLYGFADNALDDDGNRNVTRYINAATVPANNWDQVYSVKASILTRSITAVTNQTALRSYVLLDAAPYLMTDAASRQVFNSSFVINNYR